VPRPVAATFRLLGKAVAPDAAEIARNPRARSAMLRAAERTEAPAAPTDRMALGLPEIALRGLHR
jgi:16S rRNA (cytosine1402-N4)-methyltransferase